MIKNNKFWWIILSELLIVSSLISCKNQLEPTLTEQPLASPTSAPTETATQTLHNTSTPTKNNSSTQINCPLIPKGACGYPYLPAIEGYQQVFRVIDITTGDETSEKRVFTGVKNEIQGSDNPSAESFGYELLTSETTTDITIFCMPDGLLSNEVQALSENSTPGMQHGGGDFTTDYINYDGVTFKNDASPGDTWTQSMEWVITIENSPIDQLMFRTVSNFTYIGMETVVVPAGTFQAQRIDMDMEIRLGPLLSGDTFFQIARIPVTASSWHAECVGMVKYLYNAMEEEKVTELVEYSYP